MSSTTPPIFSDRYELVRHIARGGMAQVYLAKDLLLDREVALKVLFPELSVDQSFVARFRREAQAAASLAHPNIVSIFDWGQGEHTYCIVMEYIDGRTLSAVVRESPLDPLRAAGIGIDVAAALDFAHGRGVIHRDVKPGNVLIDHNGTVKVADFGIARAVGAKEGLTQTGAVMGTATYFSPEQAQGFPVDARSDVYSLGVVLYEIVAGRAPFTGDNPVSIAYKHVRETPLPLRDLDGTIPVAYEAVVAKAMAKDADVRYQSAGELQADLERFVAGQPVEAAAIVAATTVAPVVLEPRPEPVVEEVVEHYVEEPPRSRTGLYVGLLLALLAVLGVLVFFLGRSQGWWATAPTRTIPANLSGMSAPNATTELNQAGFTKVIQTPPQTSPMPSGVVITTRPAPGTKARTDQTVTLVVSAGPAPVSVPDVVSKPEAEATKLLQDAGFRVNPSLQPSDSVAAGTVISTSPPSNQQVGPGTAITLLVSSGKQQVMIPSVVGETPVQAGNKLGNLGLRVGAPVAEPSEQVQSGQVTRTDPPANSSVALGSMVTVYVSSGMAQVNVPDLAGLTQSQASAKLQNAGLKANFVTQTVTSQSENQLVISQNPGSGATLAPGSTVTVAIGQYTAPTTTTTTPPSTPSTPSTIKPPSTPPR